MGMLIATTNPYALLAVGFACGFVAALVLACVVGHRSWRS